MAAVVLELASSPCMLVRQKAETKFTKSGHQYGKVPNVGGDELLEDELNLYKDKTQVIRIY